MKLRIIFSLLCSFVEFHVIINRCSGARSFNAFGSPNPRPFLRCFLPSIVYCLVYSCHAVPSASTAARGWNFFLLPYRHRSSGCEHQSAYSSSALPSCICFCPNVSSTMPCESRFAGNASSVLKRCVTMRSKSWNGPQSFTVSGERTAFHLSSLLALDLMILA